MFPSLIRANKILELDAGMMEKTESQGEYEMYCSIVLYYSLLEEVFCVPNHDYMITFGAF